MIWSVSIFLFFIKVASAQQFSTPETCNTPDFSHQFGEPRKQTDSSWCFSFQCADLIGQHLSIAPQEQVSLIDVVRTYYNAKSDPDATTMPKNAKELLKLYKEDISRPFAFQGGGQGDLACEAYSARGKLCLERQYNTPDNEEATIQKKFLEYAERLAPGRWQQHLESQSSTLQTMHSQGRSDQECDRKMRSSFIDSLGNLADVIATAIEQDIDKACQPFKPLPSFEMDQIQVKTFGPRPLTGTISDAIKHVKENLNKKKGTGFNFRPLGLYNDTDFDAHAAIITGQEWKDDRCVYTIRDSATDCSKMRPQYLCKKNGTYQLTENELIARMISVTWMKDK